MVAQMAAGKEYYLVDLWVVRMDLMMVVYLVGQTVEKWEIQ